MAYTSNSGIPNKILKIWDVFRSSAAAPKLLQSYPTLCDPIDGSPPGCPVPGILQARTLEWVAFSFSNVWKWKVKVKSRRRVRLFSTPWTAAHQAPPSLGFSRQEYWSGYHCLLLYLGLLRLKMVHHRLDRQWYCAYRSCIRLRWCWKSLDSTSSLPQKKNAWSLAS